jgi:hypothetical protein
MYIETRITTQRTTEQPKKDEKESPPPAIKNFEFLLPAPSTTKLRE